MSEEPGYIRGKRRRKRARAILRLIEQMRVLQHSVGKYAVMNRQIASIITYIDNLHFSRTGHNISGKGHCVVLNTSKHPYYTVQDSELNDKVEALLNSHMIPYRLIFERNTELDQGYSVEIVAIGAVLRNDEVVNVLQI